MRPYAFFVEQQDADGDCDGDVAMAHCFGVPRSERSGWRGLKRSVLAKSKLLKCLMQ
jgi:hypothetical protein